ncbi:MAG: YdcF family protein [Bryobacteraceae bacterium]|nr:YdcF family protein [Bryobacteraceae bacterium]
MKPRLTPLRKRLAVCAAAIAAAILLACLFREVLLEGAGAYLNVGQPPVRADAALVLAGGFSGDRILKAAELKRQGYVPVVYVSGPTIIYEAGECEISIPFAVRHGYSTSDFRCIPNAAYNTLDEARACCAALEHAGVKSFLLVTTAYHTRRATAIYRRICPKLAFTPVASEDPMFQNRQWWKAREGRKDIFLEYTKLLTSHFEL